MASDLIEVYGVWISRDLEPLFMKYLSNNGIAMNTKTKEERQEIVINWIKNYTLTTPKIF